VFVVATIEILQRFQNKYLRIIVNASWCIINDILHHDLTVPHVRDRKIQPEIHRQEEHSYS